MPPAGPLTLHFDADLKDVCVGALNWFVRIGGLHKGVLGTTITLNQIRLDLDPVGFPHPGPDAVTYYANPPSLRGAVIPNRPVLPWANFPII